MAVVEELNPRWTELTQEQKLLVNKYINTLLLATQMEKHFPVVQKPNREILEQKEIGGVSYQLEKIRCGKTCRGCPHGPYWYAYYRRSGKVVSKYIGKKLRPLSDSYVTPQDDIMPQDT